MFWDIASGGIKTRYDLGRYVPANEWDFSPDGATATVIDSKAGTLTFWDRDRGRTQTIGPDAFPGTITGHPQFSPDGSRFALIFRTSQGKVVTLWDAKTRTILSRCPREVQEVHSLAFTPDGLELVVSCSPSPMVWRLDRHQPTPLAGHSDEAWAVAFSRDGRLLASGSDDTDEKQTIKLWEKATGKMVRGWFGGEGTVSMLAFSPDGKVLASSHLVKQDTSGSGMSPPAIPWPPFRDTRFRARSVAFSPDGALLASCGSPNPAKGNGTIRLWDWRDQFRERVLKGPTRGVLDIAFSPDGKTLASASDGDSRIWSVATGEQVAPLIDGSLTAVAFSPDGTTVATADGKVVLWDAATKAERVILSGPSDLRTLAFAPDGSILAAAGDSGVIQFFDTLTGQESLRAGGTQDEDPRPGILARRIDPGFVQSRWGGEALARRAGRARAATVMAAHTGPPVPTSPPRDAARSQRLLLSMMPEGGAQEVVVLPDRGHGPSFRRAMPPPLMLRSGLIG